VKVTLYGNLDHTGRRFGSLGLNLACEGLLLERQVKSPSSYL
jgi:hypothetical protein